MFISIFDVTNYKNFYFQKPHLFYFSDQSIKYALEKVGFKYIDFRPYQHYGIINHLSWVLAGETSSSTRMEGSGIGFSARHLDNHDLDIVMPFLIK